MFSIRSYTPNDYEMVCSWWKSANELPPTEKMLPLNSTFIMEIDGIPGLCVTVYFTNSEDICYMSSFCGNPELKGLKRKEASKLLVETVFGFAKAHGYNNVLCFAYKDKLKSYYEELGFSPTLSNMQAFVRKVS